MKKSKVRKNNILIAEFLGYKPAPAIAKNYYLKKGVGGMYVENMKYHSSWTLLMMLVDVIGTEMLDTVTIESSEGKYQCTILCYEDNNLDLTISITSDNLKSATYEAVVKYTAWFKRNEDLNLDIPKKG